MGHLFDCFLWIMSHRYSDSKSTIKHKKKNMSEKFMKNHQVRISYLIVLVAFCINRNIQLKIWIILNDFFQSLSISLTENFSEATLTILQIAFYNPNYNHSF